MKDADASPAEPLSQTRWRGPTIPEIARASGVATATVDRVLNVRGRVREATRRRVLAALDELGHTARVGTPGPRRRVAFLTESGATFNRALHAAVETYGPAHPEVECSVTAVTTAEAEPRQIAAMIERLATEADGLALVAREDLMISRAVRAVVERGVPVVCVTTDLPSSGRLAYVGSNQTSAGATAALLMGRVAGPHDGKILLGFSAPYRCQEERELGFRRVIRSEFPHLEVDERMNSKDQADYSYASVRRYVAEHGPPAGIYNLAGGNMGIARALQEEGLRGKVAFICHELNASSRMLLESDSLDFVIGHDLDQEIALSVYTIAAALDNRPLPVTSTRVRLYTKYNCN